MSEVRVYRGSTRRLALFTKVRTRLDESGWSDVPRDEAGRWSGGGADRWAGIQPSAAAPPAAPRLSPEEKRERLAGAMQRAARSRAAIPELAATPKDRAFKDRHGNPEKYLVHKNTRPGEGPWRVTFINGEGMPFGHVATATYQRVLEVAHEYGADLAAEARIDSSTWARADASWESTPRDQGGRWVAVGGAGGTAEPPGGAAAVAAVVAQAPAPAAPPTAGVRVAASPRQISFPKSHGVATRHQILGGLNDQERARFEKIEKETEAAVQRGEETIVKHAVDGDPRNGYTPERQAVHAKIMDDLFADADKFAPAPGEQPTVVLLGGRGGSGKSAFGSPELGAYSRETHLVLDADAIKERLPGYEPSKAYLYHEESSMLMKRAVSQARAEGVNVVLDITMTNDATKYVGPFREAGYKVEAHYMHLPAEKAAERAVMRWADRGGERPMAGRLVPPEVVLGMTTNEGNFVRVAEMADKWSAYSNDVPRGAKPVLLGKGGNG